MRHGTGESSSPVVLLVRLMLGVGQHEGGTSTEALVCDVLETTSAPWLSARRTKVRVPVERIRLVRVDSDDTAVLSGIGVVGFYL